jgi:hypothetical protein
MFGLFDTMDPRLRGDDGEELEIRVSVWPVYKTERNLTDDYFLRDSWPALLLALRGL